MKLCFTSFLLFIINVSIGQVVTNVKTGVWSDATIWSNNIVPADTINIVLSYDIVIDTNAGCRSLNTNGHNVTVNSGFTLNVAGSTYVADSTFTDQRDGQVYKFRHIGTQVWMAQNLNYAVDTSSCYNNDTTNGPVYGRLYSWADALIAAPPGWHLPSDSEWAILVNYLGGDSIAGGQMKETGTTHWSAPNIGATNISGFTGLPGGYRSETDTFNFIGIIGYWWSSTEFTTAGDALAASLFYYSNYATRANYNKLNGFSVRCVRD